MVVDNVGGGRGWLEGGPHVDTWESAPRRNQVHDGVCGIVC